MQAPANPFVTDHNNLNMGMFMRVAPELYLKILVVGGLDRIHEIALQFRNEGIDLTHIIEFTTLGFYMDYHIMDMAEELFASLVKQVIGGNKTKHHTQHGEMYEVNWEAPWQRVEMIPALENATG